MQEPLETSYVLATDAETARNNFFEEIQALCDEYGYNEHFIVVGEQCDQKHSNYIGQHSPNTCEGMLQATEEIIERVRQTHFPDEA